MHITMASINIYVADEFKERMAQVEANWSEVCRRAIEAELNRLTAENEPATSAVDQDNENWKQITFDQTLLEQGTVIKPSMSPNYSGPTPKEVTILSTWIKDIQVAIGRSTAAGARLSQLLDGTYSAEILIPGRPWLSGQLKLEQRLVFSYPSSEGST